MDFHQIDFGDGRRARVVVASAADEAGTILSALGLNVTDAVLMIFGGAALMEAGLETQVAAAVREAILPVAAAHNALILDGGTQAGIMEIVGKTSASFVPRPILLGVAPFGVVTFPGKAQEATEGVAAAPEQEAATQTEELTPLDPNHTHFALTPTTAWGSETETMFHLAAALSTRKAKPPRIAALLFNGGMIAKQEALRCIRQDWPLIAIRGTGRLADQIAQAKIPQALPPEDAQLAEILASAWLRVVSIADAANALESAWMRE